MGSASRRTRSGKAKKRKASSTARKKTLIFYCTFGKVFTSERIWRTVKESYIRILPQALGIKQKGYSKHLEKALCDFGWEESFADSNRRLKIHYGFELCKERVRQTVLKHAHAIEKEHLKRKSASVLPQTGDDFIIAQADGTMIRFVETGSSGDKRSKRKTEWKEVRLSACFSQGKIQKYYEATCNGVEDVGLRWGHSGLNAGWGSDSFVHVVADGAPWIKDISKQTFGQNSNFTIDLYHACEYLAQASHACSLKESHRRWTTRQKNILLKGGVKKVISNMGPFFENVKTLDIDAPVRCAIRYFKNRLDCFDYPMAKRYNLPVGSGVIEGGHRHVIQKRLKKPGMAWLKKNAQAMLQARCLIANNQFDEYWKKEAA